MYSRIGAVNPRMKQCRLQKGDRYQVAWLPVKFAVTGKYLRLHDEDGWLVVKVYAQAQENIDTPHGYFTGGIFHK